MLSPITIPQLLLDATNRHTRALTKHPTHQPPAGPPRGRTNQPPPTPATVRHRAREPGVATPHRANHAELHGIDLTRPADALSDLALALKVWLSPPVGK